MLAKNLVEILLLGTIVNHNGYAAAGIVLWEPFTRSITCCSRLISEADYSKISASRKRSGAAEVLTRIYTDLWTDYRYCW